MMKESAIKFKEYEQSHEEFLTVLRMSYRWDDQKYYRMLSLVTKVLEEYKDDEIIPKDIVFFFTCTISSIIGLISNDIFSRNPPQPYKDSEYKLLLDQRKNELKTMQEDFFLGKF